MPRLRFLAVIGFIAATGFIAAGRGGPAWAQALQQPLNQPPQQPNKNALGSARVLSPPFVPQMSGLVAEDARTPQQPTANGFFLDAGGQARVATRSGRKFSPSFSAVPYAGVGYGDSFALDTQDGGWLQLGKAGGFGFGPAVTLERHLSTPLREHSRITDIFGTARTGAFMRYVDGRDEWGRLTVTTGFLATEAAKGVDIRATKRFIISDGLTLNLGPTLSFGDPERYGLVPSPQNQNRLGATGASLQIEKELGRSLTATMSANYAMIHAPINAPALPNGVAQPLSRNRFDIGLTLSTRLFGQ